MDPSPSWLTLNSHGHHHFEFKVTLTRKPLAPSGCGFPEKNWDYVTPLRVTATLANSHCPGKSTSPPPSPTHFSCGEREF